jgi:hypothetical protein
MVVLATASAVLSACSSVIAPAYVGSHYPGDVVAGSLLGIVVVALVSAARSLGYCAADCITRPPSGH